MNVNILNKADRKCDFFVAQHPDATISHLYSWADAVVRAAGIMNFYLVARDETGIQGVLPLVHVKSKLFGNFMVSQGFSNYGGILANSQQAQDSLFEYAVKIAMENSCDTIEFRNTKLLPYDLEPRDGKMCMCLSLVNEAEDIWKSLDAKVRNQIRKAEKSRITVIKGQKALLDDFYKVYAIRMHQLGTPAYPCRLMYNILESFPDNAFIFITKLNDLTIGAAFVTSYNGMVEIPWAATLTNYNNLCPNMLLYWHIIKNYCLEGAKYFDFGRCTIDGPTAKFKKQWGAQPLPLHYQYWKRPNYKLSILSPDNPKYRTKVEMWKKMPFWLTKFLGPYISKNLP